MGVRKPDLRSFDSGNSSHGAHAIGTSLKYTDAWCAVPTLRRLSISSSSVRRYQSGRGATHVVYVALLASYLSGPLKRISLASPRAFASATLKRGAVNAPVSSSRLKR